MNFRHTTAALALAMLATALQAAPSTNPYAGDPDAARLGEELFGRNCQLCHNSRGKGGKAPSLVRGAWAPGGANSDAFMFMTISNGRPNTQMGGWASSLTEDEIWRVITFLRAESARVREADRKRVDEEPPW